MAQEKPPAPDKRAYSDEELSQMAVGERTIVQSHKSTGLSEVDQRRPILWMAKGHSVSSHKLRAAQLRYAIGSSREESDIQVYDHSMSPQQLVILPLANEWVLVDRGHRDLCTFDGIASRQLICPWQSRAVITLGSTVLLFSAYDENVPKAGSMRKFSAKRRRVEMQDPKDSKDAQIVLTTPNKPAYVSYGEALLIGAHGECDVVIDDESMGPFVALVYWHHEGMAVRPLSETHVVVDSERANGERVLDPDAEHDLVIGKHSFKLSAEGDLKARAQELLGDAGFDHFVLNGLDLEHGGFHTVPSSGSAVTVGRSKTCDIVVADRSVSRVHAQIIPSGKSFYLIDNFSSNCTFVNTERITKARVHAGDVLEIGRVVFVVHYT